MPEGPELYLASSFINNVCRGRIFGKVVKSEISKNPHITPPCNRYIISSSSRGKEMKVTLTEHMKEENTKTQNGVLPKSLDILFTFGLAGKFVFHEASELRKHAHLNFFTCDSGPDMVLSFVDYMRFGKWSPGGDFSYKERGPCVLFDYSNFRENVLKNLESSVFQKPICEVLLNQRYFNGIGNYLRAEILHRVKIPPFVSARSVLDLLVGGGDIKVKSETPDILQLCNQLPHEVINLESSWYDGEDRSDTSNLFNAWLQCYYQKGMKNIADHNKRTIWYSGPLGPLAPKDVQVRGKNRSKSKKKTTGSADGTEQVKEKGVSKKRKQNSDDTNDVSKTKKGKKSNSEKPKSSKRVTKYRSHTPDQEEDKKTLDQKKASKPNGETNEIGAMSEDVKKKLQTGRLTRKKIKEIVDAIDDISEKKTMKSKPIKKEYIEVTEMVSSDNVAVCPTKDKTLVQEFAVQPLKVSARTKTKARSENQAKSVRRKVLTQKLKLKVPMKRLIRTSS